MINVVHPPATIQTKQSISRRPLSAILLLLILLFYNANFVIQMNIKCLNVTNILITSQGKSVASNSSCVHCAPIKITRQRAVITVKKQKPLVLFANLHFMFLLCVPNVLSLAQNKFTNRTLVRTSFLSHTYCLSLTSSCGPEIPSTKQNVYWTQAVSGPIFLAIFFRSLNSLALFLSIAILR